MATTRIYTDAPGIGGGTIATILGFMFFLVLFYLIFVRFAGTGNNVKVLDAFFGTWNSILKTLQGG